MKQFHTIKKIDTGILYCSVPRREMCSYFKWGGAKYTTIVEPVLDAYEQMSR